MARAAKKLVTVVMIDPQEKKHVTRYDAADEDDPAMSTAYISKSALDELGNPESIKITIEAA